MLVRTEMRWPEQVKRAAEAKAGKRGLTAYVLGLVTADLAGRPAEVASPVVEAPKREATTRTAPEQSGQACPDGFKPAPVNPQRCYNCGRHSAFH